jgi:hypothetical protein
LQIKHVTSDQDSSDLMLKRQRGQFADGLQASFGQRMSVLIDKGTELTSDLPVCGVKELRHGCGSP